MQQSPPTSRSGSAGAGDGRAGAGDGRAGAGGGRAAGENHPAGWAGLPAGMRPRLLEVEPATLSDPERMAAVEELERLKSAAAAAQARLTAAFAAGRGLSIHPVASEKAADVRPHGSQVALARHEPPSQGDEHVRLAIMLTEHLPLTLAALEQGDISEWTATLVMREAAHLDPDRRGELDARIGPDLPRLSSRGARAAARRILAEIDAEAVRRRMDKARASRRVTMRPVGDGMAYLSILAPLTEVAGAHASLKTHALSVRAGSVDGESATGRDGRVRGVGAIMSDTALERLTGRAPTAAQPVTVNIVMTDRSLLGWGEQSCSADEPALVPGLGPIPASFAREQLADPEVEAFYRRLFTSPGGRDLVALDSQARFFPTGLRTMIALRDQQCRTPFCDAPVSQTDHVRPHASGGSTSYRNGMGLCQRCNLVKETPGFGARPRDGAAARDDTAARDDVFGSGRGHPNDRIDRGGAHIVDLSTPSGQRAVSLAPPVLGWGWRAPPDIPEVAPERESTQGEDRWSFAGDGWLHAEPALVVECDWVHFEDESAAGCVWADTRNESSAEHALRLALAA